MESTKKRKRKRKYDDRDDSPPPPLHKGVDLSQTKKLKKSIFIEEKVREVKQEKKLPSTGFKHGKKSNDKPSKINSNNNKKEEEKWDNIEEIDWSRVSLPPFKKNFLITSTNNKLPPSPTLESVQILSLKDNTVFPSPSTPYSGLDLSPLRSFSDVRLPDSFKNYLIENTSFKDPTIVQSYGWPLCLAGMDTLVLSQTGSGKTFVYLMPAMTHILNNLNNTNQTTTNTTTTATTGTKSNNTSPIALVVVPTRELAIQVETKCKRWSKLVGVNSIVIHGGIERIDLTTQLINPPNPIHLVVGTPGRLLDLVNLKVLDLTKVTFFVMDEADKLLSLGFSKQLHVISRQIRGDRQTLMLSATFPKKLREDAVAWMKCDPVYIQVGKTSITESRGLSQINFKIEQRVVFTGPTKKLRKLVKFLLKLKEEENNSRTKSPVLVFVNTIKTMKTVADYLRSKLWRADSLCGTMLPKVREMALNNFKSGKVQILVATDLASRGLDIKQLPYVINYDFPRTLDQYIHRVGRTGRQGRDGVAISFITTHSRYLVGDLIKLLEEQKQTVSPLVQKLAEEAKAKRGEGEGEGEGKGEKEGDGEEGEDEEGEEDGDEDDEDEDEEV